VESTRLPPAAVLGEPGLESAIRCDGGASSDDADSLANRSEGDGTEAIYNIYVVGARGSVPAGRLFGGAVGIRPGDGDGCGCGNPFWLADVGPPGRNKRGIAAKREVVLT
jgi:hypothetical protein